VEECEEGEIDECGCEQRERVRAVMCADEHKRTSTIDKRA
jgi:hypothetical protein